MKTEALNRTQITKRITISLPDYLYNRLKKRVPARQVSRFISQSISKKLLTMPPQTELNPVKSFLAHRATTKKIPLEETLQAIRRGRA